tara:strand:+ start:2767 stop:3576 length:810 start_codon:yes stop_codon:yes gene_type:complete
MAKEVVEKQNTELQLMSFEDASGMGFSEASTEDMSIPFIRILDKGSPQVNKRDGAHVEGAEAGSIYNTVSNEAYDGEKGVLVVPCYFNRRYIEWKPRDLGGGYMGSYLPTDPIVATTNKNDKNADVLPNGNTLVNTAQHFVLLVDQKAESFSRALITMSSTQLKKSRRWLTQMNALTAMGKSGPYTLPMMSHSYTLGTVPEQNDMGSWFGWVINKHLTIDLGKSFERHLFEAGVAFAQSVQAGEVEVKQSNPEQSTVNNGTEVKDDVPF